MFDNLPDLKLTAIDMPLYQLVSDELYKAFNPDQKRLDQFSYCWNKFSTEFKAIAIRCCWMERPELFRDQITPETPLSKYKNSQRIALEEIVRDLINNCLRCAALLGFVPQYMEGLTDAYSQDRNNFLAVREMSAKRAA